MSYGKYTILYEKDDVYYKLCKVFFGADGSYYVTSPYHPAQKALLHLTTVNYALSEMETPYEKSVDLASAEDDERRIKLSHHPDGFIQFSGEGILSGRNQDGSIRGIGVMSWPLDAPVRGPAFAVSMLGVKNYERTERPRGDSCVFNYKELTLMPDANLFILEGHYFPPLWRRFIRIEPNGTKTISVVHPAGAVLKLKVIFPSEHCARQGFIGLELYTDRWDSAGAKSGFTLSGSTGNLRKNEEGQLLGDGIYCVYPRQGIPTRRSLDYVVDEVSPQSP